MEKLQEQHNWKRKREGDANILEASLLDMFLTIEVATLNTYNVTGDL